MQNPYVECPVTETKSFIIRLIKQEDSSDLFECYHDKTAVAFFNDDNCDFGFYSESLEQMAQTVGYWIDFYQKRYFIRFSIIAKNSGKAVGTIEGFNGDTGVLRIDIRSDYEKCELLTELLEFTEKNFHEMFANNKLTIKAVNEAVERRKALTERGWEYIGSFRNFNDYYMKLL